MKRSVFYVKTSPWGFLAVLSILLVLGMAAALSLGANADGRLPGYCQRHPERPRCQTTSTSTTVSSTTTVSSSTTTTVPPPPGRQYWGTEATGTWPRSDSYCADHILLDAWEPTSHGNLPYNVPRDDLATPYDPWWTSFPDWLVLRAQVDGHFVNTDGTVPTTTEIFSFAACRWGVGEDLMRAVAVQESDWHERFTGDVCGPEGEASYGIMQIKNRNCSNDGDWGGYPRTYNSTTYNVDFYGAAFRGCLSHDFWYSYSASDLATMVRGCVGAWFSGSFQPSSSYTNSVFQHLANRDWQSY